MASQQGEPTRGGPGRKDAKRGGAGRRPTLAVVAEQAGVSLPTVSNVVNGRPDVEPDTRAGWSGCSAS